MIGVLTKYLRSKFRLASVRGRLLASSNPYIVVPVVGILVLRRISRFFKERDNARSKPFTLKIGPDESFLVTSQLRSALKTRSK